MPVRLLLLQLLATLSALPSGGSCLDSATVEVFSFDYTWTPARPVPNDTVVFQASAPQAQMTRLGLTDGSFRWYQQLPGSGFQLRHVGRSYTRRAGEAYFEGRYRLRVSVEGKPEQPLQPPRQLTWDNDLLVDVVKYVGLQKQVDIALLTNATATRLAVSDGNDNSSISSRRHIVCRFWGWPLVDTLQFLPPDGSVCDRRHFESAESEPHIDLVLGCPKLLPGTYSCYGRNSVSAAQLSCELSGPELVITGCYRPSLTGSEAASDSGGASSASLSDSTGAADRQSLPPPEAMPRQLGAAESAAASGDAGGLRGASAVVVATGCLATVVLVWLR